LEVTPPRVVERMTEVEQMTEVVSSLGAVPLLAAVKMQNMTVLLEPYQYSVLFSSFYLDRQQNRRRQVLRYDLLVRHYLPSLAVSFITGAS
jgi:hypothetical protein